MSDSSFHLLYYTTILYYGERVDGKVTYKNMKYGVYCNILLVIFFIILSSQLTVFTVGADNSVVSSFSSQPEVTSLSSSPVRVGRLLTIFGKNFVVNYCAFGAVNSDICRYGA